MREEIIAGKKVLIYDSIEELPIQRFHKFNKYMLVDAGIGSDLNDINEHLTKIQRFIKTDPKQAHIQLSNLRQSLFMVTEEINVKHLSLVALIYSIDGEEVTDLSDESIKRISKSLSEVKKSYINRIIDAVKKKIDNDLELYFSSQFNSASKKEYYDRVRTRTLLELDTIIRDNDNADKIDKIDDYLYTMNKPNIFSGKDSVEIKYDKDFESMCLFVQKETQADVRNMTTLQFYNALEHIKKQRK